MIVLLGNAPHNICQHPLLTGIVLIVYYQLLLADNTPNVTNTMANAPAHQDSVAMIVSNQVRPKPIIRAGKPLY